jgi:hypothetical protein
MWQQLVIMVLDVAPATGPALTDSDLSLLDEIASDVGGGSINSSGVGGGKKYCWDAAEIA